METQKKTPIIAKKDALKIKAIAFDLDGTLYPEYRILLPTLSIAFRHPRLIYCFSRVRKEIRIESIDTDFRTRQAALMAKHLNMSPEKADRLTHRIIYEQWLDSLSAMKPYPGIRQLILQLKDAGFKTALLSDMPIVKKIASLGLSDVWDCAYTSEETGALKPDARAFSKLLHDLNLSPEQVMYIGNNYSYDVIGAGSLGMITGFISRKHIRNNRADYIFKHFRDMERFLLSLISFRQSSSV